MKAPYIPRRGDIVHLDFDPQKGHEQAGRRPALVMSPEGYNRKVGLMLCSPITNRGKDYPYEVNLSGVRTTGVVLADQVKSLDWEARNAHFEERVSHGVMSEVLAKAVTLLDPEQF